MDIPQENYIKFDSINTRYYAEGEGSPVLLIHGMSGSACGWIPNIAAFASRHRVYALDLVGQGRTFKPDSGSLEDAYMARFVNNFMTELKIERAHVVGHSMGGAVALQLAFDFPERVNKLVIVDSGELGKEIDLLFRIYTLPLIGELLAFRQSKVDFNKYFRNLRTTYPTFTGITDDMAKILYQVEGNPKIARMILKALRERVNLWGQKSNVIDSLLRKLPSINKPTLVIWGRGDKVVPLSHGELLAKTMPDAHLVVIDQCNHVPMFEQTEIFNGLVSDFLED